LVIPLLLTWFFSAMLCYVLWRRKQRLKKCSRALQKQECYRDKRTEEKEYDSSFALSAARYSNSESPSLDPGKPESDQPKFQIKDLPKIVIDTESSPECIPRGSWTPKPQSSEIKRPSSFDVFFAQEDVKSDLIPVQDNLSKTNVTKGLLKSQSYQNVRKCPMSKKILLKVSWDGKSDDSNHSEENCNSPFPKRRNDSPMSVRPIRFAESPACSPTEGLKSDIVRSPMSRMTRRRSSIFRAKEFMMSNTFESNVAKSLMAVVIALSFSVLPFLCTLPALIRHSNNSQQTSSKNVSLFVSAVMVLLSNSLWNCLIYGARTRYFRSHLARICSKLLNCCRHRSSLTKQLSHIFSTKTSFFNTGNESK